MAFSAEDLAQLAGFISGEVKKGVESLAGHAAEAAVVNRTSIVGTPDVPMEAGPEFYIHLADGSVVTSRDSQSTHMDVDGQQVQIIGRWQVGA